MAKLMFREHLGTRHVKGEVVLVEETWDGSGIIPDNPNIERVCDFDDMEAVFKFMANTFPGGWTVEEGEVKSVNSSSAVSLREEVLDLLRNGYRARAIKLYKERMDCDIGTARDYVEGLMKINGITMSAKYICPNHDSPECKDASRCQHSKPHNQQGGCFFSGTTCKECVRVYET